MPWTLFFNSVYDGDTGTDWVPQWVNLATTGTPIYTGRYKFITRQLVYFRIDIDANGGTSTSTQGSTAVTNFPLSFSNNGICFAVSGLTGTNAGMVYSGDNRIYVPSWSAVSVPLTVIGIAEVI